VLRKEMSNKENQDKIRRSEKREKGKINKKMDNCNVELFHQKLSLTYK